MTLSSRPSLSSIAGLLAMLILVLPLSSATLLAQEALAPGAGAAATPEWCLELPFPVLERELAGHLAFLAHERLRGRQAGSPEGSIAAAYIAAEFKKLGLHPAGESGSFEQPFAFMHAAPAESGGRLEVLRTANVLAWIPGSHPALAQEYLLLGAHYDHLGIGPEGAVFPGADDNASGVAGLLGVARALSASERRPRRSILLVAFGGEERGLVGSRHYVEHPVRPLENLVAMLNLDMIGRGRFLDRKKLRLPKALVGIAEGPGVGLVGGDHAPALLGLAKEMCVAAGLPAYAPQDFPLLKTSIQQMVAGRADHAPFEEKKIPCLFFSTGEHDDYHLPSDTVDKVDPQTVRRVGTVVFRTLMALDASEERPAFRH